MTVLLVLFTIVLFLVADHVVQRVRLGRAADFIGAMAKGLFTIPSDIALALNHTWIRDERGNVVTIGLDEFLSAMTGPVERLVLPEVGAEISPSAPSITLQDRGKTMGLSAPMPGRVLTVNQEVLREPKLAQTDPYGRGWLIRIAADRSKELAPETFSGENAKRWLSTQLRAAKDFLIGSTSRAQFSTLADGGTLAEGVLKACDADVWRRFGERFASLTPAGRSPVSVNTNK